MPVHRLPTGFLSWVRCQPAAPRDLIWYADLGDRLVALRPHKVYRSCWLTDLRGTGVPRDVAYKSMAFVAVLTRKQIRRYVKSGLSWSHVTVALGAAGRIAKTETEKQKADRRKIVEGLLDRAASKQWSVRRLRQAVVAAGKGTKPRGQAANCLLSQGWNADIALLTRFTNMWVRHSEVWRALAKDAEVRRRPSPNLPPGVEAALRGLEDMIESARRLREALGE